MAFELHSATALRVEISQRDRAKIKNAFQNRFMCPFNCVVHFFISIFVHSNELLNLKPFEFYLDQTNMYIYSSHEQTAQMVLCLLCALHSVFSEARVFLFSLSLRLPLSLWSPFVYTLMYVTLRYLVYDTNIFHGFFLLSLSQRCIDCTESSPNMNVIRFCFSKYICTYDIRRSRESARDRML